jgi:predicted nucleic acid-binding protein
MTGEEMERAIAFLLQSQGNHESRLGELMQQIAETNRIVQLNAETQTEFIQIVTRHIEAQGEINASLRASVRELTSAQLRMDERAIKTDERANKTDERLDRIATMLDRHIVEGHGDS